LLTRGFEEVTEMDVRTRDRRTSWLELLGVVVVSTVGVMPPAEAAMVVYNYVGRDWVYSGAPGPTYGTHAVATLSIDDSLVPLGFTGTLAASQFTAMLGTDAGIGSPLTLAGDWIRPAQGPPPIPAFVTFTNGQIIDWSFGTVQSSLGNTFTFGSLASGDAVYPFPRVVNFGTASAAGPGTWTQQAVVPLPAAGYLLVAGLAGLGAATRGGVRRPAERGI
jgi:hypothetical protein